MTTLHETLKAIIPASDAAEALRRMPQEERLPKLKNVSEIDSDTQDVSEEIKEIIRKIG